jgi:hypothetical protein
MADENESTRPSGIVGPDGRVPRSQRNRQKQEEQPPTTAQVREWITAGSIAAFKNCYEQLTSETSAHLEKMEEVITQRVLDEVERRSLRGRVQAWWARLRNKHVTAST